MRDARRGISLTTSSASAPGGSSRYFRAVSTPIESSTACAIGSGRTRPSSAAGSVSAGAVAAGSTYAATADTALPDPIFELIARENAAFDRLLNIIDQTMAGEINVAIAAQRPAHDAVDEAMIAVCQGAPQTLKGLVAVLVLFEERARDSLDEPYVSQLAGIVAGAQSLARRA